MRLVKVSDGAVVTYPYNRRMFQRDNPSVSIPLNPTAEQLAEFGLHIVQETAKPADDADYNTVEIEPQLVNGVWTQTWRQDATSDEEKAIRQAHQDLMTARAEIAADNFVKNFVSMTPAQIDTYITNNVTDLASATDVLKKMAKMLLILARKEYAG